MMPSRLILRSEHIFLWLIAIVLSTLLALIPLDGFAQSRLQTILSEGKLRVGTTGDFNPMSVKNPTDDSYQGFDIDLVTQLAKDLEVELVFVPTDWKTLVNGIVADKYDITTSASVTPGRAKVAGYSDPYIYFGTIPMTLASNLGQYSSWSDLDKPEITVAVTLGTSFEAQAENFFKQATIKKVEPPAREYQEVLAGRADVSLTSNIEAVSLMQQYDNLKVINTDAPLTSAPGAFLVAQGDQIWINYLNHWLSQAESKGFLDNLYQKWFVE